MLATVGKLLDIHPIFRKFTLTLPKSFWDSDRSYGQEGREMQKSLEITFREVAHSKALETEIRDYSRRQRGDVWRR